jgi:5-methylthioadenosine/S-adenosylhomocysteine deaminase
LSVLVKGGLIVTQNPRREVLEGDVLIDGDKISKVGDVKGKADEVMDAQGCVVMPGLVNCHTHVAMALMRGLADDVKLEQFLERTFAIDAKRSPDDIGTGATLGCVEMVRSGTTCFLDLYYSQDVIAKSVEAVGIRGYLGWSVLDEKFTTQKGIPLKNCEKFIRAHRDRPLVTPVVAPQGIYVCSDETLAAAKDLARRERTFCHYHLSETRHEVYEHQGRSGARPVEHLAKVNFLSKGDVAAHAVWLTMNEVKVLAKAGVAVAHCPTSNMKLAGGGVAPVPEMHEHGVVVGLGTDGCSSNNSLDMFLEMKFASLLQKSSRWDATVLPAQKVLDMATIDGARCLGADKRLGSIEPGKKADIVVVDCRRASMRPLTPSNAVANLVYASPSGAVRDVLVDGSFVLRNWKCTKVDEASLLGKADAAVQELLSKID